MSVGEPSPEPKPAPRLGSYLLVQSLGSGGMSNVFRAVHEETGSIVAVKVLPRTLAKNVTLLQRFIREAKSAEALDHPNIVAIYDRGFDQGRHYLVLEYVEGRDLHDRVRINGTMASDEAVRFIREVAGGLKYAAGLGMIHRDVKPANLLMTPDGHAKIIDLGLALQTDDEDERVTRDGTTVGTVDYMAPEQARDSRQTSERSDIYSLGCTFFYLMTGSAPYPGGSLSDRLARHYKAPIPDVRAHRQDLSEDLSLLIRKMMEKKPELRFANYDQLIEALDNLGKPNPERVEAPVLDALIDDDDDDDDEIGLAPTELVNTPGRAESGEKIPSTHEQFLMAEIVDDEDDGEAASSRPAPTIPRSDRSKPRANTPTQKPAATRPAEISLAELAAFDSDEREVSNRRSGQRPNSSSASLRSSQPVSEPRLPASSFQAMIEEEEEVVGSDGPVRKGIGEELSLKTWIAAGVLIGLSLAIVFFGVTMIIGLTKPPRPPEVAERQPEENTNPEPVTPVTPRPNRPTRPIPPVSTKSNTPNKESAESVSPPEVARVAPPAVEKAYAADWETRLYPKRVTRVAQITTRTKIVVRRVIESGDEIQTSSLSGALGKAEDLVEIADTGPFFEDNFQITGKTKVIRARAGIRPMIRVDLSSNDIIKEQIAKFVLGGTTKIEQVILEGLDIVVDVRALPEQQTALFLCQGVELVLRDCTLTVINANDAARVRRFSIFRVEEGVKPNQIVLERSMIRGPVRTLFDVAAGRASIILDRSIVIGDGGPLIALENAERAARTVVFHRSLLASRGPLLEIPAKPPHLVIRSLGSTFARIDGSTAGPMIQTKGSLAGDVGSVLDWAGEDNAFVGWSSWLAANLEATARVGNLEKLRTTWLDSDGSSHESPTPWPVTILRDDLGTSELTSLAPELTATLVKVAAPHARLKDLTIGSLLKLNVPELSASMIPPYQPPPVVAATLPPPAPPKSVKGGPPSPNEVGPRPKTKAGAGPNAPPKPPEPLNLTFNVAEGPWFGDLGAFLTEKIVSTTYRVTVQVRGSGTYPMTPIRLPDGLSIGILGDSIERSKIPMPTFVPKPGAAGRVMIELHGGDLAIANLGFASEAANRPKQWLLVEDSLLGLRHCRFRDSGGPTPENGPVISFIARSTRPIAEKVGPLASATNRPTARLKDCLIWTGGEAISAEVGRGSVELENCLIISGGPAISLQPQKVAREAFEADLVLERCTVAVDKTSILVGPWPGDSQGPSRPWLISTRRCVFPRTQTSQAGALLQADPETMARGVVFWQSSADIYDLARFLAPTGPQPTNILPANLKKQWIDIWGSQHTRNDVGRNPGRNDELLRYKDKERPKPGKVLPAQLELDAKAHKEEGVDFADLPLLPRT